ncbi:MAG TPA: phenylalanine--tRNA ligase subunit beta [Chitinophagaceae bacterium]|nr:phenylalanine--tRNA ligase subunit beta [Chitinophagaceae bacterium]
MTISYNWLCDYLPEAIDPEKLSKILTSIGLEVESLEHYESIKGGLQGLVVGEVLECTPHPNADKLKLTKVETGTGTPLHIVCGAPNVALGQKVIVAGVGVTIYPVKGEPLTMSQRKIRGEESQGMLCAQDEVGIGESHEGIVVLPENAVTGSAVKDYFPVYSDWIYEIGLTPNRMDAMSHLGVARDVCAYLSHHNRQPAKPKLPFINQFKADNHNLPVKVTVENTDACPRYAGVSISGVTVKNSPQWLQDKLKAIGQRPINNIVDITNFILHETGQPLHAFDADMIAGHHVIVKNLPEGTAFISLDGKERKLSHEDLMICDGDEKPMCIGGVFGGLNSGVKDNTTNIFLESAWFNSVSIRKSSFRHGLRTEAATHFEKGVDISACITVLKRAALLIKELGGGEIASDVVDIYPQPKTRAEVVLKNHYLKKLSGKNYHPDTVKKILTSLGFEIMRDGADELWVLVPFSKPDISLPADVVEEIVRIDGLDNIAIPTSITISPAVDELGLKEGLRNKMSDYLVGLGFNEILTNSITNSKYFDEATLAHTVKMINNLSAELDVLRPGMLETALESIAYNINRKNANLKFFEFGKTYSVKSAGHYKEDEHFCVYITGDSSVKGWRTGGTTQDVFTAKGLATALLQLCGLEDIHIDAPGAIAAGTQYPVKYRNAILAQITEVGAAHLQVFDIKQPVYCIDIQYGPLLQAVEKKKIVYAEVSRFPAVERDLAFTVSKATAYADINRAVKKLNIARLQGVRLFDVFESEKLGTDKKSMAVNFTFLDEDKTLTDKEVDGMMQKIAGALESEVQAEVRK